MPELYIDGYPVVSYGYRGRVRQPSYKVLKLYLMDKYKVCYHCGIEVHDYPHIDGVRIKDDTATIDHLRPRQERKRFEIVPKVLACHHCNHIRNEAIQAGRPDPFKSKLSKGSK